MTAHQLRGLDALPGATDEPQPAAVPATHEVVINGVRRDALFVWEIAPRLFGTDDNAACKKVRLLINSGELFARSTGQEQGGSYLIPVSAYVAYLRGEKYPPDTG